MKHLPHPRTDIKSLCGLPFGGWRKDGRRHFWPELSDVSPCKSCNAIQKAALKRRHTLTLDTTMGTTFRGTKGRIQL